VYHLTLLNDAFAPITSGIGFLDKPHDEVAAGLYTWRTRLHGSASVEKFDGGFIENVTRLEPLTSGVHPRELVVQTQNPGWSALFDCGLNGGDPTSTVGYLAQTMQCRGVAVYSIPHTMGTESPGRYGAIQLQIFGPHKTYFINYVRTLSVAHDGNSRWRFDANGTVQDFEDTAAYTQRSVRKRFTEEMLSNYCLALGLEPFSIGFYSGPSALVTNPSGDNPRLAMSLSAAQTRLGINVLR
jgi:hypothetical protein